MALRVIDTDVWSYIYKGRNEAKLYQPHLFGNVLGRPISAADAWIAATSLLLNAPLIRHNKNHFIGVSGLQVISEK